MDFDILSNELKFINMKNSWKIDQAVNNLKACLGVKDYTLLEGRRNTITALYSFKKTLYSASDFNTYERQLRALRY